MLNDKFKHAVIANIHYWNTQKDVYYMLKKGRVWQQIHNLLAETLKNS